MDTLGAFARGQMARAMGAGLKVFDWHKAARRIKESGAMSASAGLSGDWEWTGGDILRYGRPLLTGESYTYLASIWATPELEIEGGLTEDCWCWQSEHPDWGSDTRWPQSALDILAGKEPAVVVSETMVAPEPPMTEAQERAVAVVTVPEDEREAVRHEQTFQGTPEAARIVIELIEDAFTMGFEGAQRNMRVALGLESGE